MDSFSEPYTRQGDDISMEQARQKIVFLEQQHRKAGIPLSGRIIHVCHYLPITASIISKPSIHIGVLSPPATPPSEADVLPDDIEPSGPTECCPQSSSSVWSLSPRYGHSAMISGIRSLSHTHEQLIVGWTGDILSSADTVPVDTISEDDRASFQDALNGYAPDSDDEQDREAKYVPVWLDDKVAHGHYDGYCKQSKHLSLPLSKSSINHITVLWPLFHYLLWQDVATEYASADTHYPYYESVNAAFARRIAEVYRTGDLIWVHDYHLLLVPR
jgi:trehalose 6-phosphate synthase/phosphatase